MTARRSVTKQKALATVVVVVAITGFFLLRYERMLIIKNIFTLLHMALNCSNQSRLCVKRC